MRDATFHQFPVGLMPAANEMKNEKKPCKSANTTTNSANLMRRVYVGPIIADASSAASHLHENPGTFAVIPSLYKEMNLVKRFLPVALLAVLGIGAFSALQLAPQNALAVAKSSKIGAPKEAKPEQQTATFAAGCFWSQEAMFSQLKGVASVEPGYAGGAKKNPTYEEVGQGDTGHAETVNIIFDPKVISYSELLEVLFEVHNPTTKDRQGNDVGTQYRSMVFARDAEQKKEALAAIARVNASKKWKSPVVTEVVDYKPFYRAEGYHLNYYNLHPNEGYCAAVVGPEVREFQAKFKAKLK